MPRILSHAVLALAVSLSAPSALMPCARGITIIRHHLDYELPPPNAVGGGNIVDIFNAAADLWERALLDDHTIDIYFQFTSLPTGLFGGADNGVFASSEPLTYGLILFDNDGSTPWYFDPSPYRSNEYLSYGEATSNLGVGDVNIKRRYGLAQGRAAGKIDLLTIALHEIGHALGVTTAMTTFTTPHLQLTAPRPFAGSYIPTTINGGGHLTFADALMERSFGGGVRLLPSEVDILAAAQVNGFTQLNLNPQLLPEPSALLLADLATWIIAFRRGLPPGRRRPSSWPID